MKIQELSPFEQELSPFEASQSYCDEADGSPSGAVILYALAAVVVSLFTLGWISL